MPEIFTPIPKMGRLDLFEALLDLLEARVREEVPDLERVRVILNSPSEPGRAPLIRRRR